MGQKIDYYRGGFKKIFHYEMEEEKKGYYIEIFTAINFTRDRRVNSREVKKESKGDKYHEYYEDTNLIKIPNT